MSHPLVSYGLLRANLMACVAENNCAIPTFREMRSLHLMICWAIEARYCGGGGSNSDSWCVMMDRGTEESNFTTVFKTPSVFKNFVESLSVVLYYESCDTTAVKGPDLDTSANVVKLLNSCHCLLCGSHMWLGLSVGSDDQTTVGMKDNSSLQCVSCGFVTQRCMYTSLPLYEGSITDSIDMCSSSSSSSSSSSGDVSFRRCHLCYNASFCASFPSPSAGIESTFPEFQWLPFASFNALPDTCMYCGILLTDEL